ncbi:MAG TPA: S9 family peptidase [Rhizomicrobium sp.]|jgi:dipeptidyl aminopeptidase/acylaminoacyl peptidase
MKKLLPLSLVAALAAFPVAARTVVPDDMFNLRDVDDPQISPDGQWVSYQVGQADKKDDKYYTHLWMSRFDGSQTVQLTGRPKESETHARFSPDGRWIAFLSHRTDEKKNDQLWLLNRAGGEAQEVTRLPGSVDDIAWSPDSKRIVMVVESADPNDAGDDKTPPPLVIDRYRFMEDITGYLTTEHDHLYLFDVASRKSDILTPDNYSEGMPAWSPDGKTIAYFSKHHPNGDRDDNYDLMVIAAQKGATPRQIADHGAAGTNAERPDGNEYPAWSPDGKTIAFAQYQSANPRLIEYAPDYLSLVSANGGAVKPLTQALDRNIGAPHWSDDGKFLYMLVEDDRAQYLGRIPAAGGPMQHIAGARDVISEFTTARGGRFALLYSNPTLPPEAFAFDGKGPMRQISHQNEWLKGVQLSPYREISFKSKDGTEVHGFLMKPPGVTHGHLPTILRLHGGPQEQLDNSFFLEWQMITADGYALVAANPRGSTGRGLKYCAGIFADWGGVSVPDVLAAVDYAVKTGVADPGHLGVGGWSYGGMLTNYVIASDTRFKAAISGASIADIFGGYGNDEYTYDYEMELGVPWKNVAVWMRNSYPFFHADRIKTPTLFMGGTADMNVPLHNGEQMYQALKSMGVPTQLIVYPGQFHELTVPSYELDKEKRYLAWYDKYVKGHG